MKPLPILRKITAQIKIHKLKIAIDKNLLSKFFFKKFLYLSSQTSVQDDWIFFFKFSFDNFADSIGVIVSETSHDTNIPITVTTAKGCKNLPKSPERKITGTKIATKEIVDAVGDKIDVICEGGIQRGTHILKALSVGAKACSGGRLYLYALAAAGQKGVEKALGLYRSEIERDMKLMGCTSIKELNRSNIKFR